MNKHKVKILPEYFKLSKSNKKNWELRFNDRNYQAGDILVLQEWDSQKVAYTGKEITKQIVYVFTNTTLGLADGYCILSLKNVPKPTKTTLLKDVIIVDQYTEIAKAFQQLFINNLTERNAPTTHQENATVNGYVTPIKLLIEKDKATLTQIRAIFNYLKSPESEFWKPNILSTSKLREKFPQLVLKANGNRINNNRATDSDLKKQAGNAVDKMFGSQ